MINHPGVTVLRIVLAGIGKLGSSLAECLSGEGHDVVIIDKSEEAIARISNTLDALTLRGNAASISAMQEAEVENADVLIAATENDEVNIICCMLGKKLGAKYTIARIREVEYAKDFERVREFMGIDRIMNPELQTAHAIARILRFPSAQHIESFARGRVDMVDFRAREGDPICGSALMNLRKYTKNLLVAAVERGDDIFIPRGDFVIQPGDHVHVLGDANILVRFFKQIGRFNPRAKDIMIIGASRIAFYLARIALESGMSVRVIEKNRERCEALAESIDGVIALQGDGTDMETLESEGLGSMNAFIALTDHDEDNLITSIYATKRGIGKVITKINHINYMHLLGDLGLDSIISPREIIMSQILRIVRGLVNASDSESIETLHRLLDGRMEAAQFDIPPHHPALNVPLRDLALRPDVLIAALLRGKKVIIPGGDDAMQTGDSIIAIAHSKMLQSLEDVFA